MEKYPILSKILGKEVTSEKIRRKDGSYSERGLWDNIRAKKARGEKPRKPGSKGAPTKKAFEKSQAEIEDTLDIEADSEVERITNLQDEIEAPKKPVSVK
jgi:hypothetical protein